MVLRTGEQAYAVTRPNVLYSDRKSMVFEMGLSLERKFLDVRVDRMSPKVIKNEVG